MLPASLLETSSTGRKRNLCAPDEDKIGILKSKNHQKWLQGPLNRKSQKRPGIDTADPHYRCITGVNSTFMGITPSKSVPHGTETSGQMKGLVMNQIHHTRHPKDTYSDHKNAQKTDDKFLLS